MWNRGDMTTNIHNRIIMYECRSMRSMKIEIYREVVLVGAPATLQVLSTYEPIPCLNIKTFTTFFGVSRCASHNSQIYEFERGQAR